MSEYWNRLVRWWHWLWVGLETEDDMRRHLENECWRFGGTVTWLPKSRR